MLPALTQLPLAYLLWHFTTAWGDLWRLYTNMVWFFWNLFSIKLLAGTLLSPWHRLTEQGTKDSAGFLGKLIINTLTRIFGFFVRLGVILSGFISIVIFSVLSLALFVLWAALPLIGVIFLVYGIHGLSAVIFSA